MKKKHVSKFCKPNDVGGAQPQTEHQAPRTRIKNQTERQARWRAQKEIHFLAKNVTQKIESKQIIRTRRRFSKQATLGNQAWPANPKHISHPQTDCQAPKNENERRAR